jgi:hypothetical protein
MISPKAKAKELISKFNNSYDVESKTYILYQNIDESKRCALITVNLLIDCTSPSSEFGGEINIYTSEYWNEVRNEILNVF